jgi:hypothetical protein
MQWVTGYSPKGKKEMCYPNEKLHSGEAETEGLLSLSGFFQNSKVMKSTLTFPRLTLAQVFP